MTQEPQSHQEPQLLQNGRRPEVGETIELRAHGITVQTGQVELTMPDGSGFWLAADGADQRRFVPPGEGETQIWIQP